MKALDRVKALLGSSIATEQEIADALEGYGIAETSTVASWQIQYAAADLLETEALNLYRQSAVTRVEDISINEGAVAKALMDRAAKLRADADPDEGVLLTAEFHPGGAPWT